MEIRLARFLAIALVVAVLGGMLLTGRARKLERQIATPLPADDSVQSGPPDSAGAVALALHAYRVDHRARGEFPPEARVIAFVADSTGFLVELGPTGSSAGTRATVRVLLSGAVELRRRGP